MTDSTAASTISPADALDFIASKDYRAPRVEGEAPFPGTGKHAGTPGLLLSAGQDYDDDYRGIPAGTRIEFVVIRRATGKGNRYHAFSERFAAAAQAGIEANRAASEEYADAEYEDRIAAQGEAAFAAFEAAIAS